MKPTKEQFVRYSQTGGLPEGCTEREIMESAFEFIEQDFGPNGDSPNPIIYAMLTAAFKEAIKQGEVKKEILN